jgi:hypothetical protein
MSGSIWDEPTADASGPAADTSDVGTIEDLLFNDGSGMQEIDVYAILSHPDVLQECKFRNSELVKYLAGVVPALVSILTHVPGKQLRDPSAEVAFQALDTHPSPDVDLKRCPFVVAEIFCFDLQPLLDAACEEGAVGLEILFGMFGRYSEALKSSEVNYLCRVADVLLKHKYYHVSEFLVRKFGALRHIVDHVYLDGVADMMISLAFDALSGGGRDISWIEQPDQDWSTVTELVRLVSSQGPNASLIHENVSRIIMAWVLYHPTQPGSRVLAALQAPACVELLFAPLCDNKMHVTCPTSIVNGVAIINAMLLYEDGYGAAVDEETGEVADTSDRKQVYLTSGLRYASQIISILSAETVPGDCHEITLQGQIKIRSLGMCRLRIVKWLAMMLRLDLDAMAAFIPQVLPVLFDFFVNFPLHNIFHSLLEDCISSLLGSGVLFYEHEEDESDNDDDDDEEEEEEEEESKSLRFKRGSTIAKSMSSVEDMLAASSSNSSSSTSSPSDAPSGPGHTTSLASALPASQGGSKTSASTPQPSEAHGKLLQEFVFSADAFDICGRVETIFNRYAKDVTRGMRPAFVGHLIRVANLLNRFLNSAAGTKSGAAEPSVLQKWSAFYANSMDLETKIQKIIPGGHPPAVDVSMGGDLDNFQDLWGDVGLYSQFASLMESGGGLGQVGGAGRFMEDDYNNDYYTPDNGMQEYDEGDEDDDNYGWATFSSNAAKGQTRASGGRSTLAIADDDDDDDGGVGGDKGQGGPSTLGYEESSSDEDEQQSPSTSQQPAPMNDDFDVDFGANFS